MAEEVRGITTPGSTLTIHKSNLKIRFEIQDDSNRFKVIYLDPRDARLVANWLKDLARQLEGS